MTNSAVPSSPAIRRFGPDDRVLKPAEASKITSLSPAEIRRRVRKNGDFPRPIALGETRIGFMLSDVSAWLAAKAGVAA